MAPQVIPGSDAEADGVAGTGELRYVARQPILDVFGRVFGYELLFRAGPEAAFSGNLDTATSKTILSLMTDLHAGGLTVVVVTHSDLLAEAAERQIRLQDGKIDPPHRD